MLLGDTQNAARASPYAVSMGTAKQSIRQVLAANVVALKERRDWTQQQIAAKAGISQTHVGNVLRAQIDPTTAIIEGLSRAFDVPGWLLLVPNLPIELLDSNEVPALLQTWLMARLPR
jgi:transcriptional regulator with XRE-family HTH domain